MRNRRKVVMRNQFLAVACAGFLALPAVGQAMPMRPLNASSTIVQVRDDMGGHGGMRHGGMRMRGMGHGMKMRHGGMMRGHGRSMGMRHGGSMRGMRHDM